MIERILLALLPVPVFYLIYLRYFTFKPVISKHIEAYLSGIAFALILILISPWIYEHFRSLDALSVGFLNAALVEKTGAFIIIILLQRYFPEFTVMEATLTAMLLGLGFSTVENVFYAATFGRGVIILRILFTVPLHLTTCGIMGHYIGMSRLCKTRLYTLNYLMKGFLLAFVTHGLFDSALIAGGTAAYLAAPLLILLVVVLEFLLARSQTVVPEKILDVLAVRFEDWITVSRQQRYERWILRSMGTPRSEEVAFFVWRPGYLRIILVITFMIAAIYGLSYGHQVIEALDLVMKKEEEVIILGVFPVSISFMLIMVGAINPNFFKKSEIKMPIISDVEVQGDDIMTEYLITYDITATNCFLRTSEAMGVGTGLTLHFEFPRFSSRYLRGEVVWENHMDRQEAIGTVVKLKARDFRFLLFILRYYIFRITRGIVFLLKLPGFEGTRRFFMRPISTMQEEKLLQAGEAVYLQGDMGREFYLLKKGEVKFYKTTQGGESIIMGKARPGEVFGEMAIIGNQLRNDTAECVTDCIIAVADRDNINALISSNVEFAQTLIQTMSSRIEASEEILLHNINILQKQKRDMERYFHVAIMLTLIGLGHTPGKDGIDLNLDFEKISSVMRNMDDESAGTLISLFMKKQDGSIEEVDALDEEILDTFNELYEKFEINVKRSE